MKWPPKNPAYRFRGSGGGSSPLEGIGTLEASIYKMTTCLCQLNGRLVIPMHLRRHLQHLTTIIIVIIIITTVTHSSLPKDVKALSLTDASRGSALTNILDDNNNYNNKNNKNFIIEAVIHIIVSFVTTQRFNFSVALSLTSTTPTTAAYSNVRVVRKKGSFVLFFFYYYYYYYFYWPIQIQLFVIVTSTVR